MEVFRQELTKLGWAEGRNLIDLRTFCVHIGALRHMTIEYRFAEQDLKRLPELAADLVRLKVDLIVAVSTTPALAVRGATTTIPIVMANVGDPVGAGLVASLARPGGNVTGFSNLTPELNTKRLEILKDAVPKLSRVGLLWPLGTGVGQDLQLKEIRAAAVVLKLKLEEIETQAESKGLESAFKAAKQKQVNAIMPSSPLYSRKKADRPACRSISVSCYLPTEGVCR